VQPATIISTRVSTGYGEFRGDTQQDYGRSDAELGKVLQLRHANAFVFKKRAVRGFQVAQPDTSSLISRAQCQREISLSLMMMSASARPITTAAFARNEPGLWQGLK